VADQRGIEAAAERFWHGGALMPSCLFIYLVHLADSPVVWESF
jgi:hypothetical protein